MLGVGADLPVVLLIDDDLISREVIATLLTLNGYMLHTAENGSKALEMIDAGGCAPQVVLADVHMEGLCGLSLLKELRKRTAAAVYAISATEPKADLKAAVDGFLLKPFDAEALRKLLNGHLGASLASRVAKEPVIAVETLTQFRQMMSEPAVRGMYDAVLSDLKKRVAALELTISQRDASEARRIGHTIKGGCGMAGALQVARLGALLESESDQLDNSEAIRRELKAAVDRLERMLEVEFPAKEIKRLRAS